MIRMRLQVLRRLCELNYALDVIVGAMGTGKRARHVVERGVVVGDDGADLDRARLNEVQRAPVGGRTAVVVETAGGADG